MKKRARASSGAVRGAKRKRTSAARAPSRTPEGRRVSARTRERKSSLARAVTRKERAVREVGERNIKPGRLRIGTTRRLTPTGKGFRAFNEALLAVQRASKGRRVAFTVDLDVRFRKPDGTYAKVPLKSAGLPRLKDVRRVKRRGESDAHAFRRIVTDKVRGAVFRAVDRTRSLKGGTDELLGELEGKSPKQVRAALRRFKESRSLTFKVRLNRAVAARAGGGKSRQRGRRRR